MNNIAENIYIYEKLFCKKIINTFLLIEGIKIRPSLEVELVQKSINEIPEINMFLKTSPVVAPLLNSKLVTKNKKTGYLNYLNEIISNINNEVIEFICQKADHHNIDDFEGKENILQHLTAFNSQGHKFTKRSHANKWIVCSGNIYKTYLSNSSKNYMDDEDVSDVVCADNEFNFSYRGVLANRYKVFIKTDMKEDKIILGSKPNSFLESLLCMNIDYFFKKEKETTDIIEYYSRYELNYSNKPYSFMVLTATEPVKVKEDENIEEAGPETYLPNGEE